MACEEHKVLSSYIKEVHSSLRELSKSLGPEQAWEHHCKQKDVLKTYARNMEMLATTHWEKSQDVNATTSRITWIADFCYQYFVKKAHLEYRLKEENVAAKINAALDEENFCEPIKLLDVGSCYNPFKTFRYFDVLAIDISPANSSVLECDFLNVSTGDLLTIKDCKVLQLPLGHFEAVTFCFLLEYIPSPELRIKACKNAYKLLKSGGLLLINTPDSKHVGANAKIMKQWQHTLALIGFTRIKYEKFKHMHCMAFRKAVHKDTAVRWAILHKQAYMDGSLPIPQDSNHSQLEMDTTASTQTKVETFPDDFRDLPFFTVDEE